MDRTAAAGAEAAYWRAMADADAREARRKRTVGITITATAAVAVGAMVAVAVMVQDRGADGPSTAPTAAAAAGAPSPSAGTDLTTTTDAAGAPDSAAVPGLTLGPAAKAGPAEGRSGQAVQLTGSGDAWAEAAGASVDTGKDFTVSAVVRNDAASASKAALSQNGEQFFSFYLGREDSSAATRNRWVFKVQTAAETGKTVMALSSGAAATGRWTTLTGVYNAKAKTISLYVDGALAQTTAAPAVIPGKGPLEIGRARYKSAWADAWKGAVTGVRVWKKALTADQVAKAAAGDAAAPAPSAGLLTP
ncbi:LamG domain-containing protein [Streptomyces sp. TLI_171]|uniref:LamG domain-containing protein n=1 Tax=Streptomyces sp. TLI_171 TaxID=1938859 RepID=UPI000C456CE9|nr:LamG domain-containing protein [Streptomyces sp. TLI_171]RKE20397.1 concanavalin A-like lectin/glucanase superfamily protein [Streptomyces sp. TLI_171]